jgi:thioredoxin-dependent peroxiredoxin
MLKKGDKAPEFRLQDSKGTEIKLSDFLGSTVVLYFYPKDNTSGCTTEALDFSALSDKFRKKNAVIIGISPDSVASHKKFEEKHGLKVLLLSDTEKEVLQKYGVWQLKKMCGRESMGVVRTTIVIDKNGRIADIFEKVKVAGHADKVYESVCEL